MEEVLVIEKCRKEKDRVKGERNRVGKVKRREEKRKENLFMFEHF